MSLKKKLLIHIGALAIIIMLAFTLFSEKLSGGELVTVSTVASHKGTFYEDITFNGSVDYGVKTVIRSPFYLEIEKVLLPSNTLVKVGDVVAICSGYQVEKALLQLEASLQAMKAEIEVLKQKTASLSDETQKRVVEIELRLKEIALNEAQINYDEVSSSFNEEFNLIANTEGRLSVQNLSEGRQVSYGEVMYEIADPTTLQAVFTGPSSQEEYVNVGDKLTVEVRVYKRDEMLDWVSERQALKLEVIKKKTEAGITSYTAPITADKNERIDPQQLQAKLTRQVATYSRLLPHGCIQREMGSSYIYVVTTKRSLFTVEHFLKKLEIRVIDSNEYYTAVSGETLTDYNIVYTADGPLKDGQRVRVEK